MTQTTSPPFYAAIDLGSNSFHMLVVCHVGGSVQTMAKIKRKVRLAAGLDAQNALSLDAMQRGWDCLTLFAERLQDIPKENVRIVGTAALRTATNANTFLQQANRILGNNINIISGEEEAATIYKGVAHTSGELGRRLVLDIGGASTELIIGEGFDEKALSSLEMGCVTWLEQYFKDHQLSDTNFENAICAAKAILQPILKQYTDIGWDACIGSSGTVQALHEIMLAQGMDDTITLAKLKKLQKQVTLAAHLEALEIDGLAFERVLVFPSGLSILIAIFELFEIDTMTLAGGALREGIVYEMLSEMRQENIQARTINSIQSRYHIDKRYGEQVADLAQSLLDQCGGSSWIPEPQAFALLRTTAKLHEIGLAVNFKKGGQHSAYLLQNLELPGLTQSQKYLIAEMARRYKEQLSPLPDQQALSNSSSQRLLRIFRLSVILSHRREPTQVPTFTIESNQDKLIISIKASWLEKNPLTHVELKTEANRQSKMGWPLVIKAI